jgi:hypothetical protein
VNCGRGSLNHSLNYSHGFLEPNRGNIRSDRGLLPRDPSMGEPAMGGQATGDPLKVMADRPMAVQAMAVRATGVQPTRLARSSIPVGLPDGLIQKLTETMGAPASAKISASRHRCCCQGCERASIPHSNCLAFPDVQHCSVDR